MARKLKGVETLADAEVSEVLGPAEDDSPQALTPPDDSRSMN
jgi:hypothetical protein